MSRGSVLPNPSTRRRRRSGTASWWRCRWTAPPGSMRCIARPCSSGAPTKAHRARAAGVSTPVISATSMAISSTSFTWNEVTRNLTAILLLGLLAACSHAPPNATAAAAPATPAAQTPGTAPTPAITPLRPATPTPPSAVAQVAGSSPAVAAGSTTAEPPAPLKPPAPPGSPPVLKPPAPPRAAAPPQAAAPRQAPAPPRAPAAAPQPAAVAASPPAALNLASLEQRLRDTRAIGVFTKLSLKNQVDDLLDQFRALYRGQVAIPLY